jgi:hypothetical protein
MRFALIAAAALAALTLAPVALADPPPGFREAVSLELASSRVAGKPVRVYCGPRELPPLDGHSGATWPGSNFVHLDNEVCASLGDLQRRLRVRDDRAAWGLLTIVHESLHARGLVDENETDCAALKQLAASAILDFGFKPRTTRLRIIVRTTWLLHRTGPYADGPAC